MRILHTPWLFRIPGFRRFTGYEFGPLILIKRPLAETSDDLIVHELCHVWQSQHRHIRMWLSYLYQGYRNNPHEVEARERRATAGRASRSGPAAAGASRRPPYPVRRSGSETLRITSRRWSAISASGLVRGRSANASARASTWRERPFEIQLMPVETSTIESASAGSDRGRPGPAAHPARHQRDGEHPERCHDRDVQQPAADVVVVLVPEFVGDDVQLLGAREVAQQVVVDHDPLRRAEARDVRVGAGRAPAGVHHLDLARAHAGLGASASTSPRSGSGPQRLEAVEQRVEHDRAEQRPAAATITTTAVPGAHQQRGSRRISHSSAIARSPISTALIATDSTQSHAQPGHERVFSPTSSERIRRTIANGSTTALCATAIAAPAQRRATIARPPLQPLRRPPREVARAARSAPRAPPGRSTAAAAGSPARARSAPREVVARPRRRRLDQLVGGRRHDHDEQRRDRRGRHDRHRPPVRSHAAAR